MGAGKGAGLWRGRAELGGPGTQGPVPLSMQMSCMEAEEPPLWELGLEVSPFSFQ